MFENSNKEVIRELAEENYKSRRVGNLVAIMAIALTALLITAVLAAGISLFSTGYNAAEQAPGPEADGSIQGNEQHFCQIKELPQIEWADLVQKCSVSSLHNEQFGGVQTELLAPDAGFYHDNLVILKTGSPPARTAGACP